MGIIPATFHSDESAHFDGETLSVLEAARRAGVTQSAILRWIRNGYLAATPSSNGWQIPANLLEDAARAADDARGTASVPRRTSPTLEPAPVPIRRAIEVRSLETPAKLDDIGENIVSPLAELIRDQIDVVHDQAEVIGWLQAERARLTVELQELKAFEQRSGTAATHHVPAGTSPDHHLYDEVVSLLWKDSSSNSVEEGSFRAASGTNTTSQAVDGSSDVVVSEPFSWDVDDWFSDVPEEPSDGSTPESIYVTEDDAPALNLEDYADPGWFFARNDLQDFGDRGNDTAHGIPLLKPIVPRTQAVTRMPVESEDDRYLREMIDETERKIAQLWQDEKQLRSLHPSEESTGENVPDDNPERTSLWQRLWPLNR